MKKQVYSQEYRGYLTPIRSADRSQVMKRAWYIFGGSSMYSYSFSESLKRSWWVENEAIIHESLIELKSKNTIYNDNTPTGFNIHIADYYSKDTSQGRYCGD